MLCMVVNWCKAAWFWAAKLTDLLAVDSNLRVNSLFFKKTTTVLYDCLTLRTYESTVGVWISVCCLPHTAHQIAKKHSDSNSEAADLKPDYQ